LLKIQLENTRTGIVGMGWAYSRTTITGLVHTTASSGY